MAYYDVTAFTSTTIVTATVKQISMVESYLALTRLALLENGAKFDADGILNADTALGQVYCRYQIIPATNGMTSLDAIVAPLQALLGKYGTLTGKQYGGSTVTRTCTARCIAANAIEVTVDDTAMAAGSRARTYFDLSWEKLTEWA